MAYTFTSKDGTRYIIDDTLIREVNDKVLVLQSKKQMGDDLYVNYYIDVEYYRKKANVYMGYYAEVEGSGTEFGSDGKPVAFYNTLNYKYYDKEVYDETTCMTHHISYCEITYKLSAGGKSDPCKYAIHNNNIYEYEFWIPDTVINVDMSMDWIFGNYYFPIVHIGKNVKTLWISNTSKIVKDDAVNTSLEKMIYGGGYSSVIKLRNCVNLDFISIPNDNVDSIDFYVDKKYKSLSKKKWTHDNCLVTDYRWMVNNRPLEKIDWKGLFNRSISNEADNYMCVQTDEAVVQIPLYLMQDGQSIDADNALLIKEDEGVYYCPVTKEKTDKSIMAIQSTDCVYYVDSE